MIHLELYQFPEALFALEQVKGVTETAPEAYALCGLVLLNNILKLITQNECLDKD